MIGQKPSNRRQRPRGYRSDETDRGVSDVVAFVLTFGIVIASMAVVSTAGIDQLTNLRDAETIENAERSMQAAAAEIERIENGDPFRVLEFSLKDGDLWVNQSTIEVTFDGGRSEEFNVSSLEHRFDRPSEDLTISYESGAVVRSDGAQPSLKPKWRVHDGTAILTFVNISANGSIDTAGGYHEDVVIGQNRNIPGGAPASDDDQSLQIRATANLSEETTIFNGETSSTTVTVDVSESANPNQWGRYLEDSGWVPAGSPHAYEARNVDTLLIRERIVTLS